MNNLIQDIRYTLRQLRNNPGFAAASVLTLALGIGAATAMFSLVDRILFRSLPYPHDTELVSVGVTAPIIDGEFLFAGNYLDWKQHQTVFASFTSSTGVRDCDLTDDHPVRLACAAVASTFLPTLEIRPILGRNFSAEEDQLNAPRVALVSYHLWQDRFAGDRGVVNRSISVDGQTTQIIGVLPRDFEFPTLAHTDLLVPQTLDESIVQRHQLGPVVRVFGRMKPGATAEQTKAELQPLFNDFVQSAPPNFRQVLRLQIRSIRDLQVHDSRRAAWLLLLSALAVLLIACANAANLVLARATVRRQELAVRSALGAGRLRLFQQRLTESIALAILGGAGGTALAYFIIHTFVSLAPAGIPRLYQASVDPRILLFAFLLSLASGSLFGAVPALERPVQMLAVKGASALRRGHMRQLLLVSQVWIAVVLLASASLFVRSLRNLETEPLGINTENVVTGQFTLGQQKYSTARERLLFFEEVERKLQQLPGVDAAALSDSLPPNAPDRTMPFFALQAEGQPPLAESEGVGGVVGWRDVTPNYFSVLAIPLLRGRPFNEQDRAPEVHTIILNQSLADRLFPNQDSLGKLIQFHTDRAALSAPFTVIGITANTQNQGLGGQAGPEYYMVRHHSDNDIVFNYPDSQRISIIVRGAIQPQAVAQELRSAIATLDPTIPVETTTLGQSVAKLAERPRFSAALLSFFAVVGLLLTALGVYGLVSLLVNQRTQEIGIRMALGATRKNVVTMMVRQASLWIAIGALLGAIGSVAAARWINSLLFGIRANDPVTLAGATVALVFVAMTAAWIPARRTAKVEPVVALRYE
ncbi:MAG TPA: ABC transporter permease [Candidatus Sulfotelmatobacter sp.]|nr:ABC transporter permease [Candidatus Sulfotelmatobacter sp.]